MADNGRTLQIYPQLGARGSASDLTARTIVRVSFDSGTYTSPQIGAYVDLYYSAVSRITRDLDRRVCQGARPDPKPPRPAAEVTTMRCQIVVALVILVAGCTPTTKQMRDRFSYEMESCIGKLYSTFATTKECTGTRQPDRAAELTAGNKVLTFDDFWGMHGIRRERCRVTLELRGDVVAAVAHEGSGCYMPY